MSTTGPRKRLTKSAGQISSQRFEAVHASLPRPADPSSSSDPPARAGQPRRAPDPPETDPRRTHPRVLRSCLTAHMAPRIAFPSPTGVQGRGDHGARASRDYACTIAASVPATRSQTKGIMPLRQRAHRSALQCSANPSRMSRASSASPIGVQHVGPDGNRPSARSLATTAAVSVSGSGGPSFAAPAGGGGVASVLVRVRRQRLSAQRSAVHGVARGSAVPGGMASVARAQQQLTSPRVQPWGW
jgi:hypothetical protein